MDPLHPIVPIPPNIPPITPAPMIGRLDRDGSHTAAGQDKRRRRRPAENAPAQDRLDYADDEFGEDDGLHIDVRA